MAEPEVSSWDAVPRAAAEMGPQPISGIPDRMKDKELMFGSEDRQLLAQIREDMETGREWWGDNWDLAAEDLEFLYHTQWPEASEEAENDVELEMNILPQHIHHVTGDARRSKFSVHVAQVGGLFRDNMAPVEDEGPKTVTRSEIMEGMIRDVEYRSDAPDHYCSSMRHAVESGFGWLRIYLMQPWEDPKSIEARVESIEDRFSVMLDPYGGQSWFKGAKWGSIMTVMSRDEFEARWPDAMPLFGSDGYGDTAGRHYSTWWGSDKQVRVIEYFWKKPVKRTTMYFRNPETGETLTVAKDRDTEKIRDEMQARGFEIEEVTTDSWEVWTCKATYNEILEGPMKWPGMDIPIIPVLGRELKFEEHTEFAGLTRFAKDPQRMVNFWMSALTQRIDIVPDAPYMATPDQLSGHMDDWKSENARKAFVLMYNDPEGTRGPPQRQDPPPIPAAEIQAMMACNKFLYDAVGIHEPSLGKRSNETSGRAIMARQEEGDTGTFDFIDNLRISIRMVGDQLIDLIPRIYDSESVTRILLPDGTGVRVRLNHEVQDEETGRIIRFADLSQGRYKCRCEVGAAVITQRREFVQMITEIGRANPQVMQYLMDIVVKNLDIPNGEAIAKRLRHLMPREMLSPEEQAGMPEPAPTPEQELEMKKLEVEQHKADRAVEIEDLKRQTAEAQLETARIKTLEAAANAEGGSGEGEGGGGGELSPEMDTAIRNIVAEMTGDAKTGI